MHLFSVEAAGEEVLSQEESSVRGARRSGWLGSSNRHAAAPRPLPASRLPCPVRTALQALQARFVDYIKGRKTVGLDELAAEFRTKVQEVISRVQALEAEGAVTGVMDDRGKVRRARRGGTGWALAMMGGLVAVVAASLSARHCSLVHCTSARHRSPPCPPPLVPTPSQFIFVSSEEMQAVADFIRQRGRIAIAELAHKSNQFIDLEAKATAAAELELPDAAGAGA